MGFVVKKSARNQPTSAKSRRRPPKAASIFVYLLYFSSSFVSCWPMFHKSNPSICLFCFSLRCRSLISVP
ncbi:hypothetical protein LINGRAHAP2_LOCUS7187 [Linum grandiflorum]